MGTFAARGFSGHLVTTAIEHSAVLENARALAELGVELTVVDPGPSGHIDASDIAAAMRPQTVLVSVMHANNETGAIQPVGDRRIADRAGWHSTPTRCTRRGNSISPRWGRR